MRHEITPVAIVGGGGWGTGIATILGSKGIRARWWVREPETADEVNTNHTNERWVTGARIPECIKASTSMQEVLAGVRLAIFVVPSQWLREVCREAGRHMPQRAWVLSGTKGIETETGLRMSQVIGQELGPDTPIAAISGPNLSVEICQGMPAAAVVATRHAELALAAQDLMLSPTFRVYTDRDIAGVELGGALKNVVALASGACDGLGFGANTRAALLTRGLAEIKRLGTDLGAKAETFAGLSGMGDLIATCSSQLSRNWQTGNRLARGESLDEIREAMGGKVAEGVTTALAACELAERRGVDMPIASAVRDVIQGDVGPREAVTRLMEREGKTEVDRPSFPA